MAYFTPGNFYFNSIGEVVPREAAHAYVWANAPEVQCRSRLQSCSAHMLLCPLQVKTTMALRIQRRELTLNYCACHCSCPIQQCSPSYGRWPGETCRHLPLAQTALWNTEHNAWRQRCVSACIAQSSPCVSPGCTSQAARTRACARAHRICAVGLSGAGHWREGAAKRCGKADTQLHRVEASAERATDPGS